MEPDKKMIVPKHLWDKYWEDVKNKSIEEKEKCNQKKKII